MHLQQVWKEEEKKNYNNDKTKQMREVKNIMINKQQVIAKKQWSIVQQATVEIKTTLASLPVFKLNELNCATNANAYKKRNALGSWEKLISKNNATVEHTYTVERVRDTWIAGDEKIEKEGRGRVEEGV